MTCCQILQTKHTLSQILSNCIWTSPLGRYLVTLFRVTQAVAQKNKTTKSISLQKWLSNISPWCSHLQLKINISYWMGSHPMRNLLYVVHHAAMIIKLWPACSSSHPISLDIGRFALWEILHSGSMSVQ